MAGSISVLGLGSGLQLQDILDQLREADEAPLKTLESKKETLNEQITQFNQLNQDLLDIKSVALDLSLESPYIARTITVSNESVVTATVSDGAVVGQYSITVSRLAKNSSWQGPGLDASDSVVNDTGATETFSYHLGSSGDVISLEVPDQTTLEGLAKLINEDANNPGVTATVINDGDPTTPYKLVLRADNSGEDNRIYIDSQLSGYTLTEVVGAGGDSLDAELNVDGITYKRASNTNITDIFSGVTMNLVDSGNTTISVESDIKSLKEKILDLVDKANTFIDNVKSETGYDEDNEPQLFTFNSTIRGLPSRLFDLFSTEIDVDGSITSLYDLGFTLNSDGKFEIDESKLDTALQEHFDDVKLFLVGDAENNVDGLASVINDTLRDWTNASTGILATEEQNASSAIDRIDSQIEATKARLDRKYEILARQFAELDNFMNNMNAMSDYLTQQFNAISGNKQ